MSDRWFDPVGYLVRAIMQSGLELLTNRYYGVYFAKVADIEDPEERGRVRLIVPALRQSKLADVANNAWALPMQPGLSNGEVGVHGMFWRPSIGDEVFVQFVNGDPESPVYSGGFVRGKNEKGDALKAKGAYGFRTAGGHEIVLNDELKRVVISKGVDGVGTQSFVALDDEGAHVRGPDGTMLYLDSGGVAKLISSDGGSVSVGGGNVTMISRDGSSVEMRDGKITIIAQGDLNLVAGGSVVLEGSSIHLGRGGSPAVIGTQLSQTFATHVHGGPGTPPVAQPLVPGAGLSTKVFLS